MANPIPGWEARDLGNGTAATYYDDGSVVIWNIASGDRVGGWGPQQNAVAPWGSLGGPTPSPDPAAPGGPGAPTTIVGAAGGKYPSAPSNPWTVGAGTAGAPYGQGWGWGPDLTIRPEYMDYLRSQTTGQQGGYIPGSSTFNQFRLDQPGLLTSILGQPVNARYGQGGTGDPTTGREPQTPQEWLNGPRAFGWEGNMGQTDATRGMDYVANLFGRPDAGTSGISTAAWSAPDQYWKGLADLVQRGVVKASAFGLKALAAKGYTVQPPGGPVDLGSSGRTAGTAGGAAGSGGGQSGSDRALQDYYATITANAQAMQAAQLAYQDWMMRTQDDEQAFQHAQQEYENKWQEQMQKYQEQRDQWTLQQSAGYFDVNGVRTPTLAGIAQEAALTGQYQGKPTFQREQYETSTMQNLLGLQASLRGPENYGQYLKVLGSTPQGMRDVVNAAAGRFTMPSTAGVNGQPQSADVQSLVSDVGSGNQGAQQEWQQALSGGLPNPNQFNLANWTKMLPSQKAMLQSAYETQGWDVNDYNAMIQQSAPVGTGGQTGSYRF